MITCHKMYFVQRCRERGYTIDEAMPCVVSKDGDMWTIDETHKAYPRKGLGDFVAAGLESIGITKKRVRKILGGSCGCQRRQVALNKIGRRIGL